MYEYNFKLVKVVDGDTIDVDIDLGFGVWLRNQRIRMMGIDTPESRTRDLEEKKFGLIAKEKLIQLKKQKVMINKRVITKIINQIIHLIVMITNLPKIN